MSGRKDGTELKKSPGIETTIAKNAAVMSVSPNREDGVSLERIFHESDWTLFRNSKWNLIARPTLASAFAVLRDMLIPIVICQEDLLPGTWRERLEHIALLDDPPLLIVTSRLADDRLWAEALNLGAYDVLAKPFDAREVCRIVALAWHNWEVRHQLHANRTHQRMSATGT